MNRPMQSGHVRALLQHVQNFPYASFSMNVISYVVMVYLYLLGFELLLYSKVPTGFPTAV